MRSASLISEKVLPILFFVYAKLYCFFVVSALAVDEDLVYASTNFAAMSFVSASTVVSGLSCLPKKHWEYLLLVNLRPTIVSEQTLSNESNEPVESELA